MRYAPHFTLFALGALISVAVAVDPFNGKDLKEGWSFKKEPNHQSHWKVGAAMLNPGDPRTLKVGPGSELVNDLAAAGGGWTSTPIRSSAMWSSSWR